MARKDKKAKNDLKDDNISSESTDALEVEVLDDEKSEATDIPYKEPNYFKRVWIELRKINWSSSKNTWRSFFIVLVFVIIVMAVLFGFTAGVLALFEVMGL